MRITLLGILLMCCISGLAQDTVYFDKNWNESTKEDHVYLRPYPLYELGELVLIKDYHRNGNLQMQGYAYKADQQRFVGDVYWYDANGFDAGFEQYTNSSDSKKLSYLYPDGELWQEITYHENGKKKRVEVYQSGKIVMTGHIDESQHSLSGVFPGAQYADSRLRNYSATIAYEVSKQELLDQEPIPQPKIDENVTVVPPSTENIELTSFERDLRTAFSVVTLWQNGIKATETRYAYDDSHYAMKIKQAHWTQDGSLVSDASYPLSYSDEQVAHDISYYTQNLQAIHIAQITPKVNERANGIGYTYYPNGHIEFRSEYSEDGGLLNVTVYEHNGSLSHVSTYRDGQPYDGKFSESFGRFVYVYQLTEGVIDGDVYLMDSAGQILERGLYRAGKPIEGIVYHTLEDGSVHRAQYQDGQLHGVQTRATSGYSQIEETYEMRNDVMEGERVIYRDGQPSYQSEYRQGKVFSGTILANNDLLKFDNGTLKERIVNFYWDMNNAAVTERFDQDRLVQVVYKWFTIEEMPQDSYIGNYRNGKPYDGFFALDTLLSELVFVDYYEKGKRLHQYYFDFLAQLDHIEFPNYDRKTTFDANGQVVDGVSHHTTDNGVLLITTYVNSRPVRLDLNFFAMHYFNRMSVALHENYIAVSDLTTAQLKLSREGDFMVSSIWQDGELIETTPVPRIVDAGSPNSVMTFFLEGDDIETYSTTSMSISSDIDLDNHLYLNLHFIFPTRTTETIGDFFNRLLAVLREDERTWYASLNAYSTVPYGEENYVGFIEYDEDANISTAIIPQLQRDGSILLEGKVRDQTILTERLASMSALRSDLKNIIRAFTDRFFASLSHRQDEN